MIKQTLLTLALLVPSIGFAVDTFDGTSLMRTASLSPTNAMETADLPATMVTQETEPPTQKVGAQVKAGAEKKIKN